MTTTLRRLACLTFAAPLVLALSACNSGEADTAELSGEPIDPIEAPAGQSWTETAIATDMGGIQVGNPDAPLKLVEYASHTCPTCARFAEDSHAALEDYIASGVVSFEIRNQVHDGLDLTFAMLARCGDPATFHPLANQGWASLGEIVQAAQANPQAVQTAMSVQDDSRFQQIAQATGLIDWFAARGISRDQAMQCLSDPALAEQIVQNSTQQSTEFDVTGTPTLFLNGRKIEGSSWAAAEAALQEAGAR